MRRASRYLRLAVLALAVDGAAGCGGTRSDPTSLVVEVESDLVIGTDIDAIAVNGHSMTLTSAADLPLILAFTPSGASSEPIAVTAIARWHGTDVVEQSVTTAFQAGKARLLLMRLDRSCIAKTCDANQTCESGACGPRARTPTPYPATKDGSAGDALADGPASGDGPPLDAAGDNNAQMDASVDHAGNTDARDTSPSDAIALDSGTTDVATAICGDGVTDTAAGEACDYLGGADHADCNGTAAPALLRCHRPTCGDGYINTAAGEICDPNPMACGTCNACTDVQPASTAIGTITAVAASFTNNGQTFTVSDGINQPVIFEFNDNPPTDPTDVQIVRGSSSSTQMATKIAAAINGVGVARLNINAQVNTSNRSQVLLTNGRPGSHGNVNFAETIGNFRVSVMTGGFGFDCGTGLACSSNDDCVSGVCCLGDSGTGACPCPSNTSCALSKNTCLAPSCDDGVANGTETDLDCGGNACPKCTTGQTCAAASDCTSGVCTQSSCFAPTCSDHVKNGA